MYKTISAIGIVLALFATPALAQQKSNADRPGDRAMSQAVAFQKRLVELFNKRDAAGIAALYTSNAIFIDPAGNIVKGRASIENAEANIMKAWGDFKFASTVTEAGAVGSNIWLTADSTIDGKGPNGPFTLHVHSLNIAVHEGKDWKVAATSLGADLAPPGEPSTR